MKSEKGEKKDDMGLKIDKKDVKNDEKSAPMDRIW